jgi:hypothetical protein
MNFLIYAYLKINIMKKLIQNLKKKKIKTDIIDLLKMKMTNKFDKKFTN